MGLRTWLSKPIVAWLNRERTPRPFPLSDYDRICFELKQCDILLIEGRTRISEVIKLVTQSPWSHAALYLGRIHDIEDPDLRKIVASHYQGEDTDRLVIESLLGHGTLISNLEKYRKDHLRICRPSRLSHKDARQIVRYAVSRLGLEYDVRQIFDLGRFLFPWIVLPRRWRSSLFQHNPGRSTRTVCSTMIAEAFAFVDFPILPLIKGAGENEEEESGRDHPVQLFRRNPKLCTPSDFDYSPYFEIIKYPFVDFHQAEDYHLLPWHGSAQLSDEETDLYLDVGEQTSSEEVDEAIQQAIQSTEAPTDEEDHDDDAREAFEEGEESAQAGTDDTDYQETAEEPPDEQDKPRKLI